ncbi:MAG: phosphatase PAP2 family protein [Bdellovibrionota bacterium]
MVGLDLYLFDLINKVWTAPWADAFFPWITDLHKTIWFPMIFYPMLLVFFVIKFRTKGIAIFLLCALAVGTTDLVGNYALKKPFKRMRPGDIPAVHAIVRSPYGGYSFISNHAANMACVAFFVSTLVPGAGGLFWLAALVVAYSRVYVGVHFPADVCAGILLGIIIGLIYVRITQRIFPSVDLTRRKSSR